MKEIYKNILFVLATLISAKMSPYVITVVNQSSEPIYFSYDTPLSNCGAGEVFPDPKITDVNNKTPIAPGQQSLVNVGAAYGNVLCEKIGFSKLNIFIPATIESIGKKVKTMQKVAQFDLVGGLSKVTGKLNNVTYYVSNDLESTTKQHKTKKQNGQWRISNEMMMPGITTVPMNKRSGTTNTDFKSKDDDEFASWEFKENFVYPYIARKANASHRKGWSAAGIAAFCADPANAGTGTCGG